MDISWDRLRYIFRHPKPPREVWEKQFDYSDEVLQRLSKTPWEEIDFSDLWYYHHDLAYVELQADLFAYLFPVCLMDWHETLLRNQSCSHGDSEFHYGVYQGRVFEKMLTPQQRADVFEFFRDSFLIRLDRERGFLYRGSGTPAYGWIHRFNSLGRIMPRIDLLWDSWWSLATPGRAVAAIQYCSGLMYFEGENPLFGKWTPESGGGGPHLWENDTLIHDVGWMPENAQFLEKALNVQFVIDTIRKAVAMLANQPEHSRAMQVENDLADRIEIIESRVRELPSLLIATRLEGWTV
jgi:hypothetical protein